MHPLHQILALAAGREKVKPGEFVVAKVDLAEINDLYLQVLLSFKEMGGDRVWDPQKITFVMDHYAPAPNIKAAENQKRMREFAKEVRLFQAHLNKIFRGEKARSCDPGDSAHRGSRLQTPLEAV